MVLRGRRREEEEAEEAAAGCSKKNQNPTWQCGEQVADVSPTFFPLKAINCRMSPIDFPCIKWDVYINNLRKSNKKNIVLPSKCESCMFHPKNDWH